MPDKFELVPQRVVTPVQSPLIYLGGKYRMVSSLVELLPPGVERVVSPFCGGCAFELSLAAAGMTVIACDAHRGLIDFWNSLKHRPVQLIEHIYDMHPMTRERFYHIRDNYRKEKAAVRRGAAFYMLSRCAFAGNYMAGFATAAEKKFAPNFFEQLRDYDLTNIQFKCQGFQKTLNEYPDDFIFADPPYPIGKKDYYGEEKRGDLHADFPHEELRERLRCRKVLVTYGDCEFVRDLYEDCEIHEFRTYVTTMDGRPRRPEVIIEMDGSDELHWEVS